MVVEALVREFLATTAQEVDEPIVEYIVQLLTSTEQDEESQAAECICALCPCTDVNGAFTLVHEARRLIELDEIAHQDEIPVVYTQRNDEQEDNNNAILYQLHEIAPQLTLRSIETIFNEMFSGNVARAAEYLVSHYCTDDSKYLSLSLEQATDVRDKIISKWSDEEIRVPCDGKPKPCKIKLRPEKKQGLVRYYKDKIVTTKGIKYVEEKKVEYDSGAHGRVKTKGKRGKWIQV
ncbi:hypothetical protein THRCLA_21640 [Thraustotheca clavata]|uniref:Uncharacterized protein n=1 Tax=Thraustotheca clavata TaxID=74557 RepID=A0A1V9ZST9_9STRA|nr:hypothetical protein THRCLA_21640 [Thraustotheca clavata]